MRTGIRQAFLLTTLLLVFAAPAHATVAELHAPVLGAAGAASRASEAGLATAGASALALSPITPADVPLPPCLPGAEAPGAGFGCAHGLQASVRGRVPGHESVYYRTWAVKGVPYALTLTVTAGEADLEWYGPDRSLLDSSRTAGVERLTVIPAETGIHYAVVYGARLGGDYTLDWVPLRVTGLTVTSLDDPVLPGRLRQFTAIARFHDGTVLDVTSPAIWFSLVPGVASVGPEGTAVGLEPGKATVGAFYRGRVASLPLTVTAPRSVAVSRTQVRMGTGTGTDLKLTAVAADGGLVDVTAEARWRSSNPAAATVEKGRVTGHAAGAAVISAKYGGYTTETGVEVQPVTVLRITPGELTIKEAERAWLKAEATFGDGTAADVSADARWRSSVADVAGVFEGGQVSAYNGYETEITAAYGGMTARAAVHVLRVESIEVEPPNAYLKVGRTVQLKVWGIYTGGAREDLTGKTRWSSLHEGVARVSPTGLVTAVAPGQATIYASAACCSNPVFISVEP